MTQKSLLQSAGDGTAVPSGYVGEKKGTSWSNTALSASVYTNLGSPVTLEKGVWLLSMVSTGGSSNGNSIFIHYATTASTTFGTGQEDFTIPNCSDGFTATTGARDAQSIISPAVVVVSNTATYYAKAKAGGSASGGTTGQFTAVRIA